MIRARSARRSGQAGQDALELGPGGQQVLVDRSGIAFGDESGSLVGQLLGPIGRGGEVTLRPGQSFEQIDR